MEYVEGLWHWPDYFVRDGCKFTLHTGGWSGNESLVHALMDNVLFVAFCWVSSRRGGHYEFELPGPPPAPSANSPAPATPPSSSA